MGEGLAVQWTPSERDYQFVTLFFQDEITILPGSFSIIPGVKVGHNEHSGFEYQPALKSVWTLSEQDAIWASVSRAVRIPSRFNEDVRFISGGSEGPGGTAVLPTIFGSRDFGSEELLAYELGFRGAPSETISLDIVAYYHRYNELQTLEAGAPFLETGTDRPAHLVLPITFDNQMSGDTYGVEFASVWRPTDFITLAAAYTFTEVQLDLEEGSADIGSVAAAGRTPHNMASLRGHFNLPWDFEFDAMLYYVDSAPAFDVSSYIRTDLRLGYRVNEHLTLDVVGQNVFDDRHREFGGTPVEIERAVFGRATYRFG